MIGRIAIQIIFVLITLVFSSRYASAGVPVINGTQAESVTSTSAEILVSIQSDGGSPIIDSGIVYWADATPDITDTKENTETYSDLVLVTDLSPNTLYHFRVYATNSSGTAYTADATFITLSEGLVYQWTSRTIPGNAFWTAIASSADGSRLIAANYYIYTSIDSGITWTERTSAGMDAWVAVASSSDGSKLIAQSESAIYTSNDSGESWTIQKSATDQWTALASSSDGTKLTAVERNGFIYTSTDSGVTWVEQASADIRNWTALESSSDGTRLVSAAWGGYICTSTNSGTTWLERTSAGRRLWTAVASSSDGARLVAAAYDGYIYTSTNSGATWEERTTAGIRSWSAVASSSDGTRLVAVECEGYVYTSTDSGATWTQQTSAGPRYWQAVASSSDGAKVVAVEYEGFIYTSSDSGASWTRQMSPNTNGIMIASSSDGTKLFAVEREGYIYTSPDSGATWAEGVKADDLEWGAIASSSDGTVLVYAEVLGYITTSVDSGATWTQQTSPGKRHWQAMALSSDGTKLVAASRSGFIYTTTDYGTTWTEQTNAGYRSWSAVASSSDGTKLVAAELEGYIYTSGDSGVTWTARTSNGKHRWSAVASSSDGTRLIAAEWGGYIYTSLDSGATWEQKTGAGNRHWEVVASSSDGIRLVAADDSWIYISADFGTTWTQQAGAGPGYSSLWISPDGSRVVAGGDRLAFGLALPTLPFIDCPAVPALSNTSATIGATIESNGGPSITAAGIAYGAGANPEATGNSVSSGATSGAFTVDVTGLTPNTVYHYRGYATNSQGTSYTLDGTFTTLSDAPGMTAASGVSSAGFTANWTAPSGTAAITGYRLDVAVDPSFTSYVSGYRDLSMSGLSQAVSRLAAGTIYYYRVRAVNAGGPGSNSDTISVASIANAPVATAATGANSAGFTAHWTAPAGTAAITGYRLDVAADSGFTSFVSGYQDLPVPALNQTVGGLTAGTTYYYRVRAVNAGGTSSNSSTIFAATVADAPMPFAAQSVTPTSFLGHWTAPAGTTAITGYRLDVAADSDFTSFVSGYQDLYVPGVSKTVSGLATGTTYYYRVRAVNAGGASANSSVVIATTIADAPAATAATGVTMSGFTANWTAPTGDCRDHGIPVGCSCQFKL